MENRTYEELIERIEEVEDDVVTIAREDLDTLVHAIRTLEKVALRNHSKYIKQKKVADGLMAQKIMSINVRI